VRDQSEALDLIEQYRSRQKNSAGALADVAIYSEGAFSYKELLTLTPLEIDVIVERLERYHKKQNAALNKT
jgi:antitoxin component HigA of HigAB toxin-antitoxin module